MRDLTEFKERQRTVWSLGDYAAIARRLQPVAVDLVAAAEVGRGQRVLDVAAGTGNGAMAALERGAKVTASDLTPAMVESGRVRTGDRIGWVEADAEALPFDDATFDVVVSCFGLVFAPRPDVAIGEAFRVVRPGGTVAFTAWTPDGSSGRLGRIVLHHLSGGQGGYDATEWGVDSVARERVSPHAAVMRVEHDRLPWHFDSLEAAQAENERSIGALQAARRALNSTAYAALMEDLLALTDEVNEADDGTVRFEAEYLRIVASS